MNKTITLEFVSRNNSSIFHEKKRVYIPGTTLPKRLRDELLGMALRICRESKENVFSTIRLGDDEIGSVMAGKDEERGLPEIMAFLNIDGMAPEIVSETYA